MSLELLVKLQLGFVWQRARNGTTLTNPCNNLEKYMYQFCQIHIITFREIHVTTLTNTLARIECAWTQHLHTAGSHQSGFNKRSEWLIDTTQMTVFAKLLLFATLPPKLRNDIPVFPFWQSPWVSERFSQSLLSVGGVRWIILRTTSVWGKCLKTNKQCDDEKIFWRLNMRIWHWLGHFIRLWEFQDCCILQKLFWTHTKGGLVAE